MSKPKRRYRKISCRMWTGSVDFLNLSRDAKLAWLYLVTGPQTELIPGLFVLGPRRMAEDLAYTDEETSAVMAEIESAGMIKTDATTRLVWVPNAVRHNAPDNPNVVRSWDDPLDLLPKCPLLDEALASLRASMAGIGAAFSLAFSEAMGEVAASPSPNPSGKRGKEKPNPLPNPLVDPSPNGMAEGQANGMDTGSPNPPLSETKGLTNTGAVTGTVTGTGGGGTTAPDPGLLRFDPNPEWGDPPRNLFAPIHLPALGELRTVNPDASQLRAAYNACCAALGVQADGLSFPDQLEALTGLWGAATANSDGLCLAAWMVALAARLKTYLDAAPEHRAKTRPSALRVWEAKQIAAPAASVGGFWKEKEEVMPPPRARAMRGAPVPSTSRDLSDLVKGIGNA